MKVKYKRKTASNPVITEAYEIEVKYGYIYITTDTNCLAIRLDNLEKMHVIDDE